MALRRFSHLDRASGIPCSGIEAHPLFFDFTRRKVIHGSTPWQMANPTVSRYFRADQESGLWEMITISKYSMGESSYSDCENHNLPDRQFYRAADRLHEGCGEEWESGDVVWLRLRLDDQLDAGAGLKRLGEVALLAEGNDFASMLLRFRCGQDGARKEEPWHLVRPL